MTPSQPIRFGKYLLLDKIAVDGKAEFYKAKLAAGAQGVEKAVLIKKILPNLTREKELMKSFMDEAKIGAFLKHENIVRIYDLGTTDGAYFVAMEYVFGKNLQVIDSTSKEKSLPISLANALYITGKILNGLDYAHKLKDPQGNPRRIIHGKMTPDNILVTLDGEVRITDFSVSAGGGQDSGTQAGMMKGKLAYMSPQQIDGKPIDHRSDIFSTGILLYEMATGKQAFKGRTMQVFSQVRQAKFERPENLVNGQPPKLYEMIYRALEKAPEKRYQSAGEMLAALEDVASGLSPRSTQQGLAQYMKTLFEEKIGAEESAEKQATQTDVIELPTEETSVEEFIHQEAEETDSVPNQKEQADTAGLPDEQFAATDPVEQSTKPTNADGQHDPEGVQIHSAGPSEADIDGQAPVYQTLLQTTPAGPSRAERIVAASEKKDKKREKPSPVAAQEVPPRRKGRGFRYAALAATIVVICAVSAFLLKKGLAMRQRSAVASMKLEAGIKALDAGSFGEAAGLFGEVLASEPPLVDRVSGPYSRALQGRASELVKTDPDTAQALLAEAVQLDPDNAGALSQLGLVYLREGDYAKAIGAYQRVAELDPDGPDAFFNLGYIYAVNKDYAKAEAMYQHVVALAPAFLDEALFNLAMVQKTRGKRTECMKNLKQAMMANPGNEQARKYLRMLKG
jgi:serine/threonine protein kinase/thioredoxin-like negative regulator of GroEL